METVDKS